MATSYPERHFLLDQACYGLTGLNSNFLCEQQQFPRRTSLCLKPTPSKPVSIIRNRNSESDNGEDKFKVSLNIKQYDIEEITIEIMDNNVKIEGYPSPSPKSDVAGNIRRNSFEQSLTLPDDVQVENIEYNLSADGVFTLSAPRRISSPSNSNQELGLLDFPSIQI